MSALNLSRRGFLRTTGAAGGGLLVGFSLVGCGAGPAPISAQPGSLIPNAFLEIGKDNLIRFFCPRDEMGQGVTTGLTTLIAEELDVAPWHIEVALAGPHSDYGLPGTGLQGTGGSASINAHFDQLRQVGADVRQLLLRAAAQDLGVPASSLKTEDGHVIHKGERHSYASFAETASGLEMPEETQLKPAQAFKYIGKEFPRLDGMEKATGTSAFGIDIEVPGMLRAVVRRSPVAGGNVVWADKAKAESAPGVTHVVEIDSGVAVVAESYWQAKQAARLLEIKWSSPELASVDSASLKADYQQAMDDDEGDVTAEEGDLAAGFEGAEAEIENDYWAPYLAHAPMEPMNAIVQVTEDAAEFWSGTQSIAAAQGLVARYADLDLNQVQGHSAYLGGGFGRRASVSHVVEATQISLATGKPIQVLWSREDDIKNGLYRPASLMRIKAGVDGEGRITAWSAKRVGGNLAPSMLKAFGPAAFPKFVSTSAIESISGVADGLMDGWVVDPTSIEGLYEDYDLPNREVRHVTRDHGLPLTVWRSVGHSYTAFAKETMIDELAQSSGLDPVEFRLRNTQNKPRLNHVIKVAGERMRAMNLAPGRFLGLAAHESFSTVVAEVAEISVEKGGIHVHRVLCVIDCGLAVNPDVVRAQMEGAIMYGLTATVHGQIDLDQGVVAQSNFHDYPILRMTEAPDIEVIIIASDAHPTGVGEPGLPPIAPAVANAVYAATGQRLRSLPLRLA